MLYDLNEIIPVLMRLAEDPNVTRNNSKALKNACVLLREYDKDLNLMMGRVDKYVDLYVGLRDGGLAASSLEINNAGKGVDFSIQDPQKDLPKDLEPPLDTPKKKGRPSKSALPVQDPSK